VLGKDVGAKVRRLIDEHVISLGIDPKIPPISLTDADFGKQVGREANQRAKASHMEHAIRAHIREHADQDPVLYRKLSERLKALLEKLGEHWDELTAALQDVIDELRAGQVNVGDDLPDLPAHYAPFLRLVVDAVAGTAMLGAREKQVLTELTVELVDMISAEITPNFWRSSNRPAQDALGSRLFATLMRSKVLPMAQIEALVDKLMELARANHDRLGQT
jgi:type I restriction enzyme, R subunit